MPEEKINLELSLVQKAGPHLFGVDEVGRGCLAGPVVAATCQLDYPKLLKLSDKDRSLIRDSKTLSLKQRLKALDLIKEIQIFSGIGSASAQEVDQLGIVGATFLAMDRSLLKARQISMILIDGAHPHPHWVWPQMPLIKGDQKTYCIAAAAIQAKVYRDQLMAEAAKKYPQWGFDKHVGYGTKVHREALATYGACPLHRRSFAPVNALN